MTGLPFDQPYPLRRLFIRYILPGLVLSSGGFREC